MESEATTDGMLSFVPEAIVDPAPYHLLTSVVAPRPIAWITTVNGAGVANVALFLFFKAVASFPPTIMFSVSYRRREPREKDTLRNIREVGEFVCHVVDEATAGAMMITAMAWPEDTSEAEAAGLETVAVDDVRPPRLLDAPVALECRVTQIIPVEGATNVMVLGRVLRFHVRADLYRPELGLIDTVRTKPIHASADASNTPTSAICSTWNHYPCRICLV